MQVVRLTVNTDAAGAGSATDFSAKKGYIAAWELDFATTAATTATTTLSYVKGDGTVQTIDALAATNTDAKRYPMGAPTLPSGTPSTTNAAAWIPFHGKLRASVAAGGTSVTGAVTVTVYVGELI